jgi:hypothetical protein
MKTGRIPSLFGHDGVSKPIRAAAPLEQTVLLDDGARRKIRSQTSAWEDNKVILEGEELVIRVDRGRFRFSQGVLDHEDIEQAMAGVAVDGRLGVTPLRGCCGATVATQRCVTA